MPSAIVDIDSARTGSPAANEPGQAAALAACTPITRTRAGRKCTAAAIPATRPPPPVGTTMVATSDLLEDLQPNGGLAGDDFGVIERWTNTAPCCSAIFTRSDQRVVDGLADQVNSRAIRLGGHQFGSGH